MKSTIKLIKYLIDLASNHPVLTLTVALSLSVAVSLFSGNKIDVRVLTNLINDWVDITINLPEGKETSLPPGGTRKFEIEIEPTVAVQVEPIISIAPANINLWQNIGNVNVGGIELDLSYQEQSDSSPEITPEIEFDSKIEINLPDIRIQQWIEGQNTQPEDTQLPIAPIEQWNIEQEIEENVFLLPAFGMVIGGSFLLAADIDTTILTATSFQQQTTVNITTEINSPRSGREGFGSDNVKQVPEPSLWLGMGMTGFLLKGLSESRKSFECK